MLSEIHLPCSIIAFEIDLTQVRTHYCLFAGIRLATNTLMLKSKTALSAPRSQLTIVAFSEEREGALPKTLERWRLQEGWGDQIFIASQFGLYQGAMGPIFGQTEGRRDWWTFEGVTELLAQGFPSDVTERLQ